MNAAIPLSRTPREPSRNGAELATRLERKYADRITGSWVVAPSQGHYAPFPPDLPEGVARALRSRGVERLYSH